MRQSAWLCNSAYVLVLDKRVLSLEKPGLSSWKVYRDAAATQTVQCSLLMGGNKAYVRLQLTSCEQICSLYCGSIRRKKTFPLYFLKVPFFFPLHVKTPLQRATLLLHCRFCKVTWTVSPWNNITWTLDMSQL